MTAIRPRITKGMLALIGYLLIASYGRSLAQSDSPNIIVILADDQGWGTTSLAMDEQVPESASDFHQMPNLERLGARGVIFSNGYAAHPNCSPSRGSLLTGKSPAQLHLTDIIERNTGPLYEGNFLIPPEHINQLPDEEVTLAEWIKSQRPEYTAAHFGKWHLGNGGPEQHGFDASDGPTTNREGAGNPPDDPKQIFGITRRGMEWMEQQVEAGSPFYLQLSHYAVHLPMESSPSTLKVVDTWPEGERHNHHTFAGMTKDLDRGIGLLLDKVQELGIEDNTYIIYTSDNGTYPTANPGNVNGPLHGWKASVWEGGIRVPFIVTGPGITPGRNAERVVGYDIFPTVGAWLGLSGLPVGVEGGSLTKALNSEEGEIQRPHDFLVFHFPHYQLEKGSHPATAIYAGDFKLIRFYETGNQRLYHLNNDLSESQDLAFVRPEVVCRMEENLNRYLSEIDAGLPVENTEYHPEDDPGKDFQDRKQKLMNESYFVIQ